MFDAIATLSTNLFRTYVIKRFMGVFFEVDTVNKKKAFVVCYSMY